MFADLLKTLQERGSTYAPGENRFQNLELHGVMLDAALSYLREQGKELHHAEEIAINHMVDKCARAISGGLGGVVHEDNARDMTGYAVMLAAYQSNETPEEFLERFIKQAAKKKR